jgi:succinyl-CoA synthetase alpha subunit
MFGPLALDATNVYYGALVTAGTAANVTLAHVAKAATGPGTNGVVAKGSNLTAGISTELVFQGDTIYWGNGIQLCSAKITGTDQPITMALLDPLTSMISLSSEGTDLFYTGEYMSQTAVWRKPIAGGAATKLSDSASKIGLATHAGKIYFAHNGLVRMNADGTGETVLTTFNPGLTSLSTDAAFVFYGVSNGAGSPSKICKIAL